MLLALCVALFDDISCAAFHSTKAFLNLCELLLFLRTEILKQSDPKEKTRLQGHAALTLICLRLLYSLPKNVRLFKMVFPTTIFSKFVDIDTPKSQSAKFSQIVVDLLSFKQSEIELFQTNLEKTEFEIHEAQEGSENGKSVAGYYFKEQIGQGAFGKVYRAQKLKTTDSILKQTESAFEIVAIKEIGNRQENSEKISREVRTLASVGLWLMRDPAPKHRGVHRLVLEGT